MSRTRYRITENSAPHFLTYTVVKWLPILAKSEPKDIIIESLRFLQTQDRLTVFAYVIMENHLHLVARADDLVTETKRLKSYTAHQIIHLLRAEGNVHYLRQLKAHKPYRSDSLYQFWQEGSHPQLIQGGEMMAQKIEYIHNNPVRRGYVDAPAHWRYSSARSYEGMEGLLPVCTDW